MKSYQEMAEAVFREGDARLAAHKKRKKTALTTGAVSLAAAGCLVLGGWMHHTISGQTPKSLSAPGPSADVVTTVKPTAETITTDAAAPTTEVSNRNTEGTTQPPSAATEPRQQEETASAGGNGETETKPVTEEPAAPTEPAAPSTLSGAASYNSTDWTEPAVDQNGWARFPRWPGYEAKFWLYYDGRTYRCDPFAGRPLAYGEYLCALSDCAHDFADEDGAGVYVMVENGAPLPVDTAVAIVFPDGESYAMIRDPSQD